MAHSDEIRSRINWIKENDAEYQNNTYVGTNAGPRVKGRIEQIMQVINEITNQDVAKDNVRFFNSEIKQTLFHQGYICSYCGNTILSVEDCEVDHIIPYSKGGQTTLENAQLLHRQCNKHKGSSTSVDTSNDMIDDSNEE